ncbi:MAG: leucine-rich repeat domain-containing protein, partial [Clostridia bacterium]|nr:leucine-rich repeat domain-containing protein [Clostridia bacterium]
MKRKKILAVLLAALLACGVFPAGAFAEGQNLYLYEVKANGTAEITGIRDEDIEIMEIPAELDGHRVTSIGIFAFGNCGNVVSVTIPEGVTSIQDMAFGNCFRLESVSIPDSLVSIGRNAFRSERLTEIILSPDHPVFAVENEALIDKRDMTLVRFLAPEITGTYEIAQGIRAIGPSAFELDRHLSSVVIPDSVTEIGAEVFAYCDSLKEIVIPDSVVS